jgi:hypothetical protein
MALALSSPAPLANLIVVDIAPSRGSISDEFKGFVRTMRKIEGSGLKTRKEADEMMKVDVPVGYLRLFLLELISIMSRRILRFGRSYLPTSSL